MKKGITICVAQLIIIGVFGQSIILPGDKAIDKSKLKSCSYTMRYSVSNTKGLTEIATYKTEINYNSETFEVNTTLSFLNGNMPWRDHYVTNASTLKPISVRSDRDDRSLNLNFAKEITGYLQNNHNKVKTNIKEQLKSEYFDISVYPYILPALPLADGYKAIIPVFDYEAQATKNKLSNVTITKVKSDVHRSTFTGEHKVWVVSVSEESTKQYYDYYIGKQTGKIWRINIFTSDDKRFLLENNESDFNPLKNNFDKEATVKLIKNGRAVITGQAFARDNKNGGALQGMAVLNLNKKQFAWKGTKILLMPYTAYFKEWVTLNESRYKKLLPQIPLPEGASECMKESEVYDDEGNFEFKNLMPGEYLLTTKFIYEHSATQTEVVGRTDTYINGNYQGSNAITSSHNFIADARANIKKIVTINKDGENVQIKLKKTL